MNRLQQIEQHHGIQSELHHADVVLLNTPVEDIDTGVLRADKERWGRVIRAAGEIHERALVVADMVDGGVIVPGAVVDPRIIGGESASQQGGRRAKFGLMRQNTEEGITIAHKPKEQPRSIRIANRMSPQLRTAIITI